MGKTLHDVASDHDKAEAALRDYLAGLGDGEETIELQKLEANAERCERELFDYRPRNSMEFMVKLGILGRILASRCENLEIVPQIFECISADFKNLPRGQSNT